VKKLRQAIYIEALPLVPERKSGVGFTLQQTLAEFAALPELQDYKIYLVVPLWKATALRPYLAHNIKTKTILLPARAIELLMRLRLLPPVDWFLGRGVYIFANYKNWPLWQSRSLTYVYDVAFVKHPETVQPKNRCYLERYSGMWVRRADRIVTISEQVRQELEKHLGIPYTKIDIVPCGVDAKLFSRRSQAEVTAIKKKYAIRYEKYLLFVGSIEPRKNLRALLDAYAKLPKALQKEYGLVFAGGDGWLNEAFNEQLAAMQAEGLKLHKIENYVTMEDLPALYSGAAVLVHPALYEGFGMTPLEAMACETPVAVSDLPVVREVVGDAGYYFNQYDSETIAAAIAAAVTNAAKTQRQVRLGHSRAKHFSWQSSADLLHESVQSVYKQGPHRHPLLARLKFAYQTVDRAIRRLLGDKVLPAYRPPEDLNQETLRQRLYDDFLHEQPRALQEAGLKTYLGAKHLAAKVLKKAYRLVRPA
jgi:glycosyltransferase involved in cell wall biosynthesis